MEYGQHTEGTRKSREGGRGLGMGRVRRDTVNFASLQILRPPLPGYPSSAIHCKFPQLRGRGGGAENLRSSEIDCGEGGGGGWKGG